MLPWPSAKVYVGLPRLRQFYCEGAVKVVARPFPGSVSYASVHKSKLPNASNEDDDGRDGGGGGGVGGGGGGGEPAGNFHQRPPPLRRFSFPPLLASLRIGRDERQQRSRVPSCKATDSVKSWP